MVSLKVIGAPSPPRRFVAVAAVTGLLFLVTLVVFDGLFGWLLPLIFGATSLISGWSALAARAEVRAHRELVVRAEEPDARQRVTLRSVHEDDVELGLGEGRIARAVVDRAAERALKGARKVDLVGEIRVGAHVGLVLDDKRLVVAGLTDLLERR